VHAAAQLTLVGFFRKGIDLDHWVGAGGAGAASCRHANESKTHKRNVNRLNAAAGNLGALAVRLLDLQLRTRPMLTNYFRCRHELLLRKLVLWSTVHDCCS
jgi:hypothetical protein